LLIAAGCCARWDVSFLQSRTGIEAWGRFSSDPDVNVTQCYTIPYLKQFIMVGSGSGAASKWCDKVMEICSWWNEAITIRSIKTRYITTRYIITHYNNSPLSQLAT
jgi:hypothetical protein